MFLVKNVSPTLSLFSFFLWVNNSWENISIATGYSISISLAAKCLTVLTSWGLAFPVCLFGAGQMARPSTFHNTYLLCLWVQKWLNCASYQRITFLSAQLIHCWFRLIDLVLAWFATLLKHPYCCLCPTSLSSIHPFTWVNLCHNWIKKHNVKNKKKPNWLPEHEHKLIMVITWSEQTVFRFLTTCHPLPHVPGRGGSEELDIRPLMCHITFFTQANSG